MLGIGEARRSWSACRGRWCEASISELVVVLETMAALRPPAAAHGDCYDLGGAVKMGGHCEAVG